MDGTPELLLPPTTVQDAEEQVERLRELVATLLVKNQQLQRALDSRVVIEQAKGVLAERYRISVDDAFALLRRSARNHRLRLHGLATAVVASHETPVQIPPPREAAPPPEAA
jgi:AmiR/NasT family two-component response regulator